METKDPALSKTKIAETDSIGNDKPKSKIKLPDGTEIEL